MYIVYIIIVGLNCTWDIIVIVIIIISIIIIIIIIRPQVDRTIDIIMITPCGRCTSIYRYKKLCLVPTLLNIVSNVIIIIIIIIIALQPHEYHRVGEEVIAIREICRNPFSERTVNTFYVESLCCRYLQQHDYRVPCRPYAHPVSIIDCLDISTVSQIQFFFIPLLGFQHQLGLLAYFRLEYIIGRVKTKTN